MSDLPEASAVAGGRTVYGLALGVVMLDTHFPRLPGDVGNAETWEFPVAYRVVRGAAPARLARPEPDPALLEPFVEAVRQLEADGVRAVITSCGFLAAYQRELAAAATVPVFSSPLLQVPLAASVIRPDRRIGILTASDALTERHYRGAGWSAEDIAVVQAAPAPDSHFVRTFVGDAPSAEPAVLRGEVAELTERLFREHPDVGAIVLECANFPPFGEVVRRVAKAAAGLPIPVFDLYTLGRLAHLATTGTAFLLAPAAVIDLR
jgi:hypothetical protein